MCTIPRVSFSCGGSTGRRAIEHVECAGCILRADGGHPADLCRGKPPLSVARLGFSELSLACCPPLPAVAGELGPSCMPRCVPLRSANHAHQQAVQTQSYLPVLLLTRSGAKWGHEHRPTPQAPVRRETYETKFLKSYEVNDKIIKHLQSLTAEIRNKLETCRDYNQNRTKTN
jgi:hypothetical protein